LRLCQRARLVEASTARRYLRAGIRLCGRGNLAQGLAHIGSLSSRKKGRSCGARLSIWAQFWSPFSHRGSTFCSRIAGCGNYSVSNERASSSAWMGTRVERLIAIWFPNQIFGLPVGCKSSIRRVDILLATLEGRAAIRCCGSGRPILKASVGIYKPPHVGRRGR